MTEYYLATSAASGVTTSTSGWTTSIQTVTATKKYLWNYEVIAYSNGTTSTTTPVIIGTYGDKGVGISSITEHYLATSAASGVTRSTTGWTTSIQTVTNTKKYLWNYETVTYTDGSTADTDPVIIGVYGDEGPEGPEGPQGTNAPYVELSRTSILYQANNDGYSTAAQNFEINCYLKVSGNTCTISSTGNISITSITGVEVTKNSVSKITVKIPHNKIIAGVIIVQMTGTYSGKSYTAKVSITVEPNREGAQGPQGEEGPQGPQGPQGGTGSTGPRGYRGPGLRGPQDWALMDIDYQFYKGDESTQEPYEDFVVYNGNYYKCVKSHTKTSYNYPGSTADTSNGYWQLSDKLAMVAANVLFAKHGYFGSAIISGDWMISTNGTIDGTAYNNGAKYQGIIAYSLFNPNNPLGNPIAKHNSTSTVSFSASETTKTINTVSLESGKIYYVEATGRAGSASGAFYVRLRNVSTGATNTPIMINSTSNVTRAGYVNITATGSYYLEIYNSGGISGTITESKVMEKNFAPVYALDLLTGATYQGDAHVRGAIEANLFYGKTKSISAATYQIDPNTEPFSTFVYPDANGKKWIYLPKATDYDGMEIMIYQKNTVASLDITNNYLRIAPKQNSGESIFISQNIAIMNGKALRDYYPEVYPITSSVYLLPNCRYVFKSMLGAWYAIDGIFTGE